MLEIENLKTNFNTYDGVVKALDGVNLKIEDGEIFGLVGCLLYTSPSPRDRTRSRMPSSA